MYEQPTDVVASTTREGCASRGVGVFTNSADSVAVDRSLARLHQAPVHERPISKGYCLGPRTVPMARRKQEDSSAWAAVIGVAVMAWHTFHAVKRMASGESDKVNVSGHYRKDGRGGRTWVEGHKRSYPL